MFTVSGATVRTQDTRLVIAPMIGAVDTAGPPIIATMNALPLTSLAAPLHVSSPSLIVTWVLSVPPPWLEAMTPMRHALLLKTTMEIWKALPQTDMWNCQPRRGVMLHSARLYPSYFSELPPLFPLHFPYVSPPHLLKPSDYDPCLLITVKTLFSIAFILFYFMT